MISICFVHFNGGLTLQHLDAAWYSLSRQDFTHVREVRFLDNNTTHAIDEIDDVLDRYPIPVPVVREYAKHGDPTKTQSWSVNTVCQQAEAPWVFFMRSDYILAFDCLVRMRDEILARPTWDHRRFVSAWCWQMGYDAALSNTDAYVDIERYGWREKGMPGLLEHPYAVPFHATDQDAGVWFTNRSYLDEAGWMNEGLVAWGYQQSTFQRALRSVGISCSAIPAYLFAHQHHHAVRDFDQARREYQRHGGGR